MSIETDQKYLRVRNTSSETLYLSDLDNEENKLENKGVQVYIGPNSTADLPLDDEVIHSYEQGSIRGFIDDGLLSAAPYNGEAVELWVGPNGSDDNPGTRNNPLASIQTAIDRLDEELGVYDFKFVRLKRGGYTENVYINTGNVYIKGDGPAAGQTGGGNNQVEIQPDDPDKPIITLSHWTKQGYENFIADGGPGFSWTAPDTYDYTGASLDREDREDLLYDFSEQVVDLNLLLESISLDAPSSNVEPSCLFVTTGPTEETNQTTMWNGVTLDGCPFNDGSGGSPMMLKHTNGSAILGSTFYGSEVVIDACRDIVIEDSVRGLSNNTARGKWDSNLILAGIEGGDDPDEGGAYGRPSIDKIPHPLRGPSFYAIDEAEHGESATDGAAVRELTLGGNETFVSSSINDFGTPQQRFDVDARQIRHLGSGALYVRQAHCDEIETTGSGTLDVDHVQTRSSGTGDVTVSGGTNVIRGGTIIGNLDVSGGADLELRGVTIEGNVIVDGDNSTLHMKGCHVQGDITVDTGNDNTGVDVTMDGGHYMGALDDPGTNFTRNTGS